MATHSSTLYLDVPCLVNFRILMDMVLNAPVCVVVSLLCCGILCLVLRNLLFTLPKGKPFARMDENKHLPEFVDKKGD